MFEHSWTQEPRGLTDILAAEDLLFDQVWYNPALVITRKYRGGTEILMDEDIPPGPAGSARTIRRDIWTGAMKAAERVERERGKENLGPWSDCEWGMINGKLSAL